MNITALLGTLLAIELVGDICYRLFYRMVGRNKYRVGDGTSIESVILSGLE